MSQSWASEPVAAAATGMGFADEGLEILRSVVVESSILSPVYHGSQARDQTGYLVASRRSCFLDSQLQAGAGTAAVIILSPFPRAVNQTSTG